MEQQDTVNKIGSRAVRTQYEVIFKTLAIATTTGIAAGHLTTLRRISRRDRADAIVAVVGFFLLSTLPLGTLGLHFWLAFRLLRLRGIQSFDVSYYLGAALGMRATVQGAEEEASESVALVDAKYESLTRRRREYDSRWLGRLVVLLLFGAQAVMTLVFGSRRVRVGMPIEHGKSSASSWDVYNGLLALGGVFTAFASISITLLNTSWQIQVEVEQPREMRASCGTFYRVSAALPDIKLPPEEERSAVELRTSKYMLLFNYTRNLISWCWTRPAGISVLSSHDGFEDLPGYEMHPVFLPALRTVIGWVLIPVLVLVGTCSVAPLPDTGFFRKGYFIGLLISRTLLDIHSLLALATLAFWSVKEIQGLAVAREQGRWLNMMWVDPLAEKLYAI